MRFYNSAGTIVASYQYDAFGNCTITRDDAGIAALNRIRYRGYYYDSETGLYYLQSRYYNPQVGRFLNADGFVTTGQGVLSYNMFAYCQNNPVMFSDPSGNLPVLCWVVLGIIAFGTVVGGIAGACSDERLADKPKEKKNEKKTPKPFTYPIIPNSETMKESNSSGFVENNQIEVPKIQLTVRDRVENQSGDGSMIES